MTDLSRRALLQLAGLAALPAFARAEGAPEGWEHLVHEQAAQRPPSYFRADERALVAAVADAVLPRTDTPGALDVGATGFVEVIAAEWLNDKERAEFRAGLEEFEGHAVAAYGVRWPALDPVQRLGELDWASLPLDGDKPAKRAYRRLRSLVIHGYLTSERVRREVFHVNITPGHYRGDIPVSAAPPVVPAGPMGGHHG